MPNRKPHPHPHSSPRNVRWQHALLLTTLFTLPLASAAPATSAPGAAPAAGTKAAPAANKNDQSAAFQKHARKVINEMVQEFPEYGLRIGLYQNAGKMSIPDAERRKRSIAFYQKQLVALKRFDLQKLDAGSRVDWQLMHNQFESRLWNLTSFKSWQWQPSTYNVGGEIGVILNTEFAPLETRLKHVIARLEKVPAFYIAAQRAIENPTLEHTELAVLQNKGTLRVLGEDLDRKVNGPS